MNEIQKDNKYREYTNEELEDLRSRIRKNKSRNYTPTEEDLNKTIEYVLFYGYNNETKKKEVKSCLSSRGILYDVDGDEIELTNKIGLMTYLGSSTIGRLVALNFLDKPEYFIEYYYCANHRNIVKTNEWYNLFWNLDWTKLKQNNLLQFKNDPKGLYEYVNKKYCNDCLRPTCNCNKRIKNRGRPAPLNPNNN